jgi:hypothetical protein
MSVHSNSLVDAFASGGTERLGNAVTATMTEIWQSAVLARLEGTVTRPNSREAG